MSASTGIDGRRGKARNGSEVECMTDRIKWFAGVDWGSEKHRACLLDSSGKIVDERDFAHDGAGLASLCDWLMKKSGAEPRAIGVAIETPRGPVVETLLERGFQVHSINPKQLDRFRDRFTVAGAKDDSRDAQALGDSLRTDRHALRQLSVDDPVVIELREWSRIGEDLEQERNRLTNRMREQLWRYYPQALELTDDLGANWFLDLWSLVPTPAAAAKTKESQLEAFLKSHRIRRLDASEVRQLLTQQPVTVAPGTAEAATAQYNVMTLTIAVGYGGREEISDAVRSFLKTQAQEGALLSDAIERITPEAIACHLYASNLPDPDLIIRTSGEIRLSGFLLWQSVHSEFYFTDVLWPAFRKIDFLRAIRAYQARNRRFGG